MKFLKNTVDKLKPTFSEGGKLSMFHSVFDGFETFLFVPNSTSKRMGSQIHDAMDSKRTMIMVVIALIPALLFGMYNVGYHHFLAIGEEAGFWSKFFFGLLAVLPYILVTYIVGLGIEFTVAQIKKEEIAEGFLVTGIIIPMIIPINTPLWMVAVATAFAVIFAKEVFGGTGYNIFNVALITRAFLFFAYPTAMSGDKVWVRTEGTWGWSNGHNVVDSFTGATPLGQVGTASTATPEFTDILGNPLGFWDGFLGLIPGSIGETCTLAILIGAVILISTGIASWKITLSVFVGGALTALAFNLWGPDTAIANLPWYNHLVLGGFAFGAVFMATDPVTAARTETGKWIYGFFIGVIAIVTRVLNPGYPEGMMLAILFMNIFGCLIDYYVVQANIKRRLKRVTTK